jgi:hypothetical protein
MRRRRRRSKWGYTTLDPLYDGKYALDLFGFSVYLRSTKNGAAIEIEHDTGQTEKVHLEYLFSGKAPYDGQIEINRKEKAV